jgi:hypothetical protein
VIFDGPTARAALLGAVHGAAECAVIFALSDHYTLSKDWFLAVMVVFANVGGFAIAARYGVSLIGVAIAGGVGLIIGGWLGVRLIGSYEYTVPTPPEERVMRIVTKQGAREVQIPGVPAETTKRVPVGGGIGVLLGWAVGAGAYAWLSRPRDEFDDDAEPNVEPNSAAASDKPRAEPRSTKGWSLP